MNLNDFLSNYVRNRALENRKVKNYDDYVSTYAVDPIYAYADTIQNAKNTYLRSLPTYGSTGEKLTQKDLGNSGYADRLENMAENAKISAYGEAASAYKAAEKANVSGYREYLAKLRDSEDSARNRVVTQLRSLDIGDGDEAYRYAVASGLDSENAMLAASTAMSAYSARHTSDVLSGVLKYGYGYDVAKAYALGSGLTEEAAEKIAVAAEKAKTEDDAKYREYVFGKSK